MITTRDVEAHRRARAERLAQAQSNYDDARREVERLMGPAYGTSDPAGPLARFVQAHTDLIKAGG